MFRLLPIIFSLILVFGSIVLIVMEKKERINTIEKEMTIDLMPFSRQPRCGVLPKFLTKLNISNPILIDLSQKQFKGIALRYGGNYAQTLHPKGWQKYDNFSTYVSDEQGNIYLIPTPYISIKPNTFDLQKSIYKLDSITGKLTPFMFLDDVKPSSKNPYGLSAIAYDCEDESLWLAAIDESDYDNEKGVIYHIDLNNKSILQRVKGIDVLSMKIVHGKKTKFLLVGSARYNSLFAYSISNGNLSTKGKKILELPSANEHIRKIKIQGRKQLQLQSIPFGYSLIAQTDNKYRSQYEAIWLGEKRGWKVNRIQ